MTSKIITLTLVAMALFSCKDKEAQKLKNEQEEIKYQKERVVTLNKDFLYSCLITSSKTELPLENVQFVLKMYFEDKEDFVFKSNSFVVLNDDNWEHAERHNLDLIKETSEKHNIPYNDVVKIYSTLEISERIKDLENEISNLNSTIHDLESEIDKVN